MSWRTTPRANDDIDALAEHGALAYGLDRSLAYLDRLRSLFDLLAAHPYIARERPELRPGVRLHSMGSHVVFYRVEDEDVVVIRVVHAHQNWADLEF